MNKVILTGNLTKKPELRYTPSGKAYLRAGIAVQRRTKNSEGNYDVDFFNLVAWTTTAEFISKYFDKGSKIMVEGRLQNDNYEKDGVKHYGVNVIIETVEFAGSKKVDAPAESQADETPPDDEQIGSPISDDSVPF